MASEGVATARPRTAGEILDDAWRSYFADPAPLLLLSGAFLVPAFVAVLLLMGRPTSPSAGQRWLLPAGAAVLATLTGLGSGACQEFLRRRSESRPAGVATCLGAALRNAASHVALRAVVVGVCLAGVFGFVPLLAGASATAALFAALLGGGYLLLPAALFWTVAAPAHAALAGERRGTTLLSEVTRAARLDATKAAVVVLSRAAVMALAFFNLHLLIRIGLWAGMNLGGFDVALASAELSLDDPVYDIALAMLCWLLLAPYFEASSFLLYLDARTRQEGLDLLQRVRHVFPATGRTGTAARLAVVLCLLAVAPAAAAGDWPATVREVKTELDAVSAEVNAADPYPGGGRWAPRLGAAGKRLKEFADSKQEQHTAAWFERTVTGFARRNRTEAIRTIDELRERLGLLEETLPATDAPPDARPRRSKAEIKSLVRDRGGAEPDAPEPEEPPQKQPQRREVERDVLVPVERPAGPEVPMESASGLGNFGVLLVLGLFLAVFAVAAARFWSSLPKTPAKPVAKPTELPPEESLPRPDEQPSPVLWRQAEDLARAGKHREAVRALYLAVLSLLHGQRLLRYETTRTNGEYVRQVRLAAQAPAGLAEPFALLTRQFEVLWYGGTTALADDYQSCLDLAGQVRALAQA
jgi:hypothetical protein